MPRSDMVQSLLRALDVLELVANSEDGLGSGIYRDQRFSLLLIQRDRSAVAEAMADKSAPLYFGFPGKAGATSLLAGGVSKLLYRAANILTSELKRFKIYLHIQLLNSQIA